MDQVNAQPHARQKGLPFALQQEEKKLSKKEREAVCRDAVWLRDKNKSRATGRKLSRKGKGLDDRGEVHHCDKRSTHPETKYDTSVQLLLSKREHALAEAVCPNKPSLALLEIVGPADRALPQTFIWHDKDGNELRRRSE